MLPLYNYKALVLRVIDGDTFEAQIDYGCRTFGKWTIRLLGIDTPELHAKEPEVRAAAKAAADYLRSLINGKEITIHTEKADSWDRLLGEVYLGDLYVNQDLINQGHAKPYWR